jgi:hypothetical protein
MSDSFRSWSGGGGGTAAQDELQTRKQPDGLDRLGRERQAVDRLGLGMQQRETGRRRQRVADEQTGEDSRGAGRPERGRRPHRQRDDESSEENRRSDEAEAGANPSSKCPGTSAPWIPALIAQATMTMLRLSSGELTW